MSEFLTPAQVAAECGISRDSVYRLVDEGRLPAFRFNVRELRISRDALETFKQKSRVRPQRHVPFRPSRPIPLPDRRELVSIARDMASRDFKRGRV